MDILEFEDFFGANNRALFSGNDPLSIAALVHSDPEASSSPLPFLPSERRHDNHHPPLVKTRSLVDVHTPSEGHRGRGGEGHNRVVRSQSVFPHLDRSNGGTHVDIHDVAPEMPIYLLQEDEGNDEEIMRLLSDKEKEVFTENDDVIPSLQREAHKRIKLSTSTMTRPAPTVPTVPTPTATATVERSESLENKLPTLQDLLMCSLFPPPSLAAVQPPPSLASGQPPPSLASGQPPPSLASGQPPPSLAAVQPPPSLSGIQPPPSLAGSQPPPSLAGSQPPPSLAGSQAPPSLAAVQPPPSLAGCQPPPSLAGVQPPPSLSGIKAQTSLARSTPVESSGAEVSRSEHQHVSQSVSKSPVSNNERADIMASMRQSESCSSSLSSRQRNKEIDSRLAVKTKAEPIGQLGVGVLPLGSLTVCLPAGGTLVSGRYQALPLELSPKPVTPKKRVHAGGWPKGKSRKVDRGIQLPKLAASGYSIFMSEKRGAVQKECGSNSMSVLSKHIGKMWSQLSSAEKKVYYDLAEVDHQRYLSELKSLLASSTHSGSEDSLEKVNKFIGDIFATEKDDEEFHCPVCSISFNSLYNKRSHFSGKLHQQALLQALTKIIGRPIEIDNRTTSSKTLTDPLQEVSPSSLCPEAGLSSVCPEAGLSSVCPEVGLSSVCPEVSLSSVCPEVGLSSVCPEVSLSSVCPEAGLSPVCPEVDNTARNLSQLADEYSMNLRELNTVWRTFTTELLHHVHLQQTSLELEHAATSDSEVLLWLQRNEQTLRVKIDDLMNSVDTLVTFSCHSNSNHSEEHN